MNILHKMLLEKADTVIEMSEVWDSETDEQLNYIQEAIKEAFEIDGTVKMIESIDSEYKGQKLTGLFFEINDVEKGKAYFSWYCKVE